MLYVLFNQALMILKCKKIQVNSHKNMMKEKKVLKQSIV